MSGIKIGQKQIDAVLALSANKRYEYFIKVVADWEEVWGLYQNGWALAATDTGAPVFPLWPAKEYANLCAKKEWSGYIPEVISLESFMVELVPNLKADSVLVGVFYTPENRGITPPLDKLVTDISHELEKY
jgi:hypothetical protein